MTNNVTIKINDIALEGIMAIPSNPAGIIIFVHGSGSGRHSPRNNFVSETLQKSGFATLLFDLLTPFEKFEYMNRFNIDLLTRRIKAVTLWVKNNEKTKDLAIGYFGASTGAAAALNAASELEHEVKALVSRGGRPDLAEEDLLEKLETPVLLIVGGLDHLVIELNRNCFEKINGQKEFTIVKGASHLFEEPGTLEKASELAANWFKKFFACR